MHVVPSAVGPSPVAGPPVPPPRRRLAPGLILAGYLLGAVFLTWQLWADPAGRMQAGDTHDVDLFAWFLRYAATAVRHGHLPALITTTLDAPRGVNMMWNTALLLPGVLLAPLTLLAGPQASLTLILTVSIAGSAAALFWVLRRWDASLAGAAIGGAVYGFSPALLNSGTGHYHLVLAVAPPLIIHAFLRIITGRARRAVLTGAAMGLLVAAQVFTGEEPLVYTALAAVTLCVVLGARRPGDVGRKILKSGGVREGRPPGGSTVPGAARPLAVAAGVTALICAYPLWVQFRGPLHEHSVLKGPWSGKPAFFVEPGGDVLLHTASSANLAHTNYLGLPEVLYYLGWPLIVVLVAATVRYWRDMRVRATAVTCAVLELCSVGGGTLTLGGLHVPGWLLPYHWLQGLPVMAQVLPDRFCILADGAAGAVLAFALDRARAGPGAPGWRRAVPFAAVGLALVPLLPLPYLAQRPVPVPAGWTAAFARLRLAPSARVLVVPVPLVSSTEAMRWQADTGEPVTLAGGFSLGPGPRGQASFSIGPPQGAAEFLNRLQDRQAVAGTAAPALVRAALAYWRPGAVVAVTNPASPLARLLTSLLGPADVRAGRVLAWRTGRHRLAPVLHQRRAGRGIANTAPRSRPRPRAE